MQQSMICNLCPRHCGQVRTQHTGDGFCGMGLLPRIARAALHQWEEPCISGARGSGAVFFSGCVLQCVYCQNYEISTKRFGKEISVQRLADIYRELEKQGAHNINLVNPTHFVPAIVESLHLYRPRVPVVYNTSGYETVETLRLLDNLVDVYLPDLKYWNTQKAQVYSRAGDYTEVVKRAIDEMVRQTGALRFGEDGLLQKGTLIRHLLLPESTKDAIHILEYIKHAWGDRVLVSLMGQYLPFGEADKFPPLHRRVTAREYSKVENALFDLGLQGYVQQLSSAQEEYIPSFHLEGVDVPEHFV